MTTAQKYDVGAVAEFPEGQPRVVHVEGREIVVIHWNGSFYGLRNVCPHQAQTFQAGNVCQDLTASLDGELTLGDAVLVCPWHNWPFDIRTGQCTVDELKRVRTFAVSTIDGRVVVSDHPTSSPQARVAVPAIPRT